MSPKTQQHSQARAGLNRLASRWRTLLVGIIALVSVVGTCRAYAGVIPWGKRLNDIAEWCSLRAGVMLTPDFCAIAGSDGPDVMVEFSPFGAITRVVEVTSASSSESAGLVASSIAASIEARLGEPNEPRSRIPFWMELAPSGATILVAVDQRGTEISVIREFIAAPGWPRGIQPALAGLSLGDDRSAFFDRCAHKLEALRGERWRCDVDSGVTAVATFDDNARLTHLRVALSRQALNANMRLSHDWFGDSDDDMPFYSGAKPRRFWLTHDGHGNVVQVSRDRDAQGREVVEVGLADVLKVLDTEARFELSGIVTLVDGADVEVNDSCTLHARQASEGRCELRVACGARTFFSARAPDSVPCEVSPGAFTAHDMRASASPKVHVSFDVVDQRALLRTETWWLELRLWPNLEEEGSLLDPVLPQHWWPDASAAQQIGT